MPPTSIDGTDISGATIDGTEVTEITADGQVVFSSGFSISGSDAYWNMESLSGTTTGDTINDANENHDLTIGGQSLSVVSSFDTNYGNAIEHQGTEGERAYAYNDNVGSGWTESHTVAFWWNPGDPAGTNNSNDGVYKFDTNIGDYSGYSQGFDIQHSQNVEDNGGELLDYSLNISSSTDFSISPEGPKNASDNWYWVVSRWDANTRFNYRVYEQGRGQIGEYNSTSVGGPDGSGDVTLVMFGGVSNEDLFGVFDEAGIWNSFLTDQEVQDIWNDYGQ